MRVGNENETKNTFYRCEGGQRKWNEKYFLQMWGRATKMKRKILIADSWVDTEMKRKNTYGKYVGGQRKGNEATIITDMWVGNDKETNHYF